MSTNWEVEGTKQDNKIWEDILDNQGTKSVKFWETRTERTRKLRSDSSLLAADVVCVIGISTLFFLLFRHNNGRHDVKDRVISVCLFSKCCSITVATSPSDPSLKMSQIIPTFVHFF